MCWRKTVELLKLCNTPASIISPIPLFAISLFLISRKDISIFDLPILSIGITVSILSNFASNLWNHCNDLKEDKAQGKITILTQDSSMQKLALFIAIFLYLCSLLFVYYLSIELNRPIFLYFLIWALATWWYSDNLILKKIFGFRLKEHYIGELVTYGIAWPMYTFSIWQIYSDPNVTGVLISVAFFFISISGLLLKDLKDISGDRKAGLQTFGVVFSPSRLIQYSCYFMILYYLIILNPLTLRLFSTGILVVVIPFVYFLKNTFFHMHKKNWTLDIGDSKALKGIGISIYASVIFLGLSAFF
ncbi:MAG: UbiA family prenyltransferase [Candidatus Methanoperedenaceae archaeon]|nr:UbiA family prenyltransferase [Candidatus Methanoperedenaceae archaeon]